MALYLNTPKHKRDELETAFKELFESLIPIKGDFQQYLTPASQQANLTLCAAAKQKQFASSLHLRQGEATGLATELAYQKYLGLSWEQAFECFMRGMNGDGGVDIQLGQNLIDFKGTKSDSLKFIFSKTNRNRHRANAYAFAHVDYLAGQEIGVTLLGWIERHKLYPWLREDRCYRFVRFYTLQREGLIRPVSGLKEIALNQGGLQQ